jgi:outer membrane protein assembly factor BamC
MRFRYELATKPHGRSVSLKVSLIDYMETNQQGSVDKVDPIDKQRAEMAMLNEVVSQVDYEYRLQQRENRLMRANQKLVTIGENSKLEPTYLVEMDLEPLWSNLPIFFEQHGFKITDLNENKHIYFVTFVQPNVSVWDKIWGEDAPVVELENSKYTFVLTDADEQTALTIYREDGTPVPKETLTRIFPVMEPGLSFRNVY